MCSEHATKSAMSLGWVHTGEEAEAQDLKASPSSISRTWNTISYNSNSATNQLAVFLTSLTNRSTTSVEYFRAFRALKSYDEVLSF